MLGFEGNPRTEEQLRAALAQLDAVFPAHAEPGEVEPFAITYPEDLVHPRQTDLIVRKWKHDRLAMPLEALAVGRQYPEDVYIRYSIRRFAFFVPALLADWVSPEGVMGTWDIQPLAREARRRELARHKSAARSLTDDELRALDAFFVAALASALRTSPVVEPSVEPPKRTRFPRARPSDVLELASAFEVPAGPLLDRWLGDDHPIAEEHLIRLAEGPEDELVSPLVREPWDDALRGRLADRLGELFFVAKDPRAADRLSAAERRVRAMF